MTEIEKQANQIVDTALVTYDYILGLFESMFASGCKDPKSFVEYFRAYVDNAHQRRDEFVQYAIKDMQHMYGEDES